jgi:hypothetical protein
MKHNKAGQILTLVALYGFASHRCYSGQPAQGMTLAGAESVQAGFWYSDFLQIHKSRNNNILFLVLPAISNSQSTRSK